jgi:hypothetical protein
VTATRAALVAALVPLLLVAPAACGDDDPRYRSCAAAWDAGAAPLHRGDPGYSSWLDRDGDGVACADDPRGPGDLPLDTTTAPTVTTLGTGP